MGCLIIVLCLVLLVLAPVALMAVFGVPLLAPVVAQIKSDAAKRKAEAKAEAED